MQPMLHPPGQLTVAVTAVLADASLALCAAVLVVYVCLSVHAAAWNSVHDGTHNSWHAH